MKTEAKNEILEAIGNFSNNVEKRFSKIEANMITKSYLDDKLADLKGELVVAIKNNNHKINLTVNKLREKKIFKEKDSQEILIIEPFPRT